MADEAEEHEEIIIIKRGGGDHDGHHGGAWKIAFADFMTAMMAFFLVMWLINSSSEETKKAVASYFNPIKLMDKTSNPKGIRDPKYGKPSETDAESESTVISSPQTKQEEAAAVEASEKEAEMFSDPYAVLTEIASGAGSGDKTSETSDSDPTSDSDNMGISGGEAFHDPFDPSSWSMDFGVQIGKKENVLEGKGQVGQAGENGVPLAGASDELKTQTEKEMAEAVLKEKTKEEKLAGEGPTEEPELGKGPTEEEKMASEKLAKELHDELKALVGEKELADLNVSVESTGDGVVIKLADDAKHGMFAIGSARPGPELVRVMAKIGMLISDKEGKIRISGHTDGRQYKSLGYDNWRLSTARAHMAHYMLVRGGLEETRIERIEGYADSQLRIPDDALSAANRRIEIFLTNT